MAALLNSERAQKGTLELLFQMRAVGLPEPVQEFRFDEVRKWRFDLAWPSPLKLAVEIEGGVFSKGRHIRPMGFLKDIEKYNSATLHGWRLLRVTPQMIGTGEALTLIEKALR